MTNEEFERLKDFIRAQQPDEKETEARRKLYRDMDRVERVLKRAVGRNPRARQRMREEDKRWREFDRRSRERFVEISEFAARSDQKLKDLIDDIRNNPKESKS